MRRVCEFIQDETGQWWQEFPNNAKRGRTRATRHVCPVCGGDLFRSAYAKNKETCSHKCKRKLQSMTSGEPRKKNGFSRKVGGYVIITSGEGKGQRRNRFVMEQTLGRPLLPDETVHHRNGVRDDDRPENLELWTSAHPPGQRVRDLVWFANEIIAQYGSDPTRYE